MLLIRSSKTKENRNSRSAVILRVEYFCPSGFILVVHKEKIRSLMFEKKRTGILARTCPKNVFMSGKNFVEEAVKRNIFFLFSTFWVLNSVVKKLLTVFFLFLFSPDRYFFLKISRLKTRKWCCLRRAGSCDDTVLLTCSVPKNSCYCASFRCLGRKEKVRVFIRSVRAQL